MNWLAANFEWNKVRAFLATVEGGSLSAAARTLGTTQSTVGRQVTALEQELGVILFERVGRGLNLTPTGHKLVKHARYMAEGANQFSLAANGQSQTINGNICISASEMASVFWLPKIIAKIRQMEPGINIEILATTKPSDLKRREADIALRSFKPDQPGLICKKVKNIDGRLYATPSYKRRLGEIKTMKDVSKADFIGFDHSDAYLKVLNEKGLHLTAKNFPLLSLNQMVQWELAKQGAGICMIAEKIGDAEPLVERLLPNLKPLTTPLWLVSHREVSTSARVKFVFDLLLEELEQT